MELRELYQEVILDHNKKPRNFGTLAAATHEADGDNPLCGDQLHISLVLDGDRVEEVRFDGSGCAISTASASLMTEAVKGRTRDEAEQMFEAFHDLLTGDPSALEEASAELGKLAVFQGVREFPVRVKCATLAWHTLKAALEGKESPATTE
ncbi:MAG: SUF system NifU family Fe-S cluster assembly protein [Thermoanaerobaculia bacterium]|nr:SUF system NifU family Fe-S cluster assembly protein [Thermoanaerobaculia bacterium]